VWKEEDVEVVARAEVEEEEKEWLLLLLPQMNLLVARRSSSLSGVISGLRGWLGDTCRTVPLINMV
jgi:hypothetical protein